MVAKAGCGRECHLMGMYTEMNTEQELADVKKIIENAGYYWVHQTRDQFEATKADPKMIDKLFKHAAYQRIQQWLELADARPEGKNHEVYICPGEDDWW